jgi:membrane protein
MVSFWDLLKESFEKWQRDKAPRLAASLAYYTLISLAPLLVIVVAIAGIVLGETAAQGQLVAQVRDYVGPAGGTVIQSLVKQAQQPGVTTLAGALSLGVLLFGATGALMELKDALNTVWDVPPRQSGGLLGLVKDRLFPLLLLLGIGLFLLVAVLATAVMAMVTHFVSGLLPVPAWVLHAANFAVSFALVTLVFAILYDVLPERRIPWSDVWVGAAFTSLLFTAGKTLLSLYLSHSSVGSPYGAAGSVVVFVVWVYYSALLVLFGAEFTRIYSRRRGSRVADRTFASGGR